MTFADLMAQTREVLLSCRWEGLMSSPSGDAAASLARGISSLAPEERRTLSPEQEGLLAALQVVVAELDRLQAKGETGALRSLGYAVHVLPDVMVSGRWSPREFRGFSLRVAAAHWGALSIECKRVLCELAGISAARATELIAMAGFVVDMYGRDR